MTGGAGYVGAVLVPKLLAAGHRVTVLDWYLYGRDVLDAVKHDRKLKQVQGDVRDHRLLSRLLPGCDAVIHLACISNDPSAELNPLLTRHVNFDAFAPLVQLAKIAGVRRFIYASSSSVYGVSDQPNVDETHPLRPLTDYSRFKAMCEPLLLEQGGADFVPVIIRPATVCGYSPRLRLDLTVNILTNHAVNHGRITVFGGTQMRPNIHIDDIADLYVQLLSEPAERVAGKVWNAGYENHTVMQIAEMVRRVVMEEMRGQSQPSSPPVTRMAGLDEVEIVTTPTDDNRSYHISSAKIADELGFVPRHTIEDAVRDLVVSFRQGLIPDSLSDPRYFNVKLMRSMEAGLTQPMEIAA